MSKNTPLVKKGLLTLPDKPLYPPIEVGSKFWFSVLDTEVFSFRYEGQEMYATGYKMSVRREALGKNRHMANAETFYWIAYRRWKSRLRKVYIGSTESLTAEKLEAVCEEINRSQADFWLNREKNRKFTEPNLGKDDWITETVPEPTVEELRQRLEEAHHWQEQAVEILERALHIKVRDVPLMRQRMREVIALLSQETGDEQ